jgi:hypothetical protein
MQRKVAKAKDGNVGKNNKGDGKVVVGKRSRKMRGGGETFKQYCEEFVNGKKGEFDEAKRLVKSMFNNLYYAIDKIDIKGKWGVTTALVTNVEKVNRRDALQKILKILKKTNDDDEEEANVSNAHTQVSASTTAKAEGKKEKAAVKGIQGIDNKDLKTLLNYININMTSIIASYRKLIIGETKDINGLDAFDSAIMIDEDNIKKLFQNILFLKIYKLFSEFKDISAIEIISNIQIEKAGDKDSNIMKEHIKSQTKSQTKSDMPLDDVANEQENLQKSLNEIDISKETLTKEEMIEKSKSVVEILTDSSRFKKIMVDYTNAPINIKSHIEYMLSDFSPLILENEEKKLTNDLITQQIKVFKEMIAYKKELDETISTFKDRNTEDEFAKNLLLNAYELMNEILPFLIQIFEKHLAFLNSKKTEPSTPTNKVKEKTGANDAGWGSLSVSKSKGRDEHNNPFDTQDSKEDIGDEAWVRKPEGADNSTIEKIIKIFDNYSYNGYNEFRQKYNRLDKNMKDLIDNTFFVITQEEMKGLTNETNLDYNAIDRKIEKLETFDLDKKLKLVNNQLDKNITSFLYILGKTIKNECLKILREHSALLKSKEQERLSNISVKQQLTQNPDDPPRQNNGLSIAEKDSDTNISDDDGMDDGIERNALLRIFEDIYEKEVNDYITDQYKLYTKNYNKIITDYMNEQLFTKYKEAKKLITRGLPELEIDSRIDEISNFISTITEEKVDEAKTQIMKKINNEAMDDKEIAIAFINHVYTRIQNLNQIYTITLEKYKEELTNSKQSVNDPLLSILDKLKINDDHNNQKNIIAKLLKDKYTETILAIETDLKTFNSDFLLKKEYMKKVKLLFDNIIDVAFEILNSQSIKHVNKMLSKIETFHISNTPIKIFFDMEKDVLSNFTDSQATKYLELIKILKKKFIDFKTEIYNELDILVKKNEKKELNIWTGGGRQTRKPPRKEPITKTPKMKDPKQKEPTKTPKAKEPITKTPKAKEPTKTFNAKELKPTKK